jgi:hypothetical protein
MRVRLWSISGRPWRAGSISQGGATSLPRLCLIRSLDGCVDCDGSHSRRAHGARDAAPSRDAAAHGNRTPPRPRSVCTCPGAGDTHSPTGAELARLASSLGRRPVTHLVPSPPTGAVDESGHTRDRQRCAAEGACRSLSDPGGDRGDPRRSRALRGDRLAADPHVLSAARAAFGQSDRFAQPNRGDGHDGGTKAGLDALDVLSADARLKGHYRLDAVRAHLLEKAGDREAAVAATGRSRTSCGS